MLSEAPRAGKPAVGAETALNGVRICLVFEYSLSHNTRLLQEIAALNSAGATVQLLTSHTIPGDAPRGMFQTLAPLEIGTLAASTLRWRPVRIIDNLIRNALRPLMDRIRLRSSSRMRTAALKALRSRVDVFWVVDEPSLPTVLRAARNPRTRVVYETVDLVPEYRYLGERYRGHRLREERRAIAKVNGFITACDSYADYYWERYGGREITRRPVVRDNMPPTIVESTKPTSRPLRILFLGSMMFDRPIVELIEAMSLVSSDVTLTFQGKNLIGGSPGTRIDELRLCDRVTLLDPCPPDRIVEVAAEYDIGIVALRGQDENERRASTSKLFTYMSAGLAILGSNLPGIARIVDEHRNGILVDGMKATAWASAIDEIASLGDSDIDVMKRRSLEAAHERSWERQRPAFIAEFRRALDFAETEDRT